MSFFAIIMQFLPWILRLFGGVGFGSMVPIAAMRLGANPESTWADYGTWCGSYSVASVATLGVADWLATVLRKQRESRIDPMAIMRGVAAIPSINWRALMQMLPKLFALIAQDEELKRLLFEAFGLKASSLPKTENELISLALVPSRREQP